MAELAIAAAVVSAVGTIQAGQAQAGMYKAQAQQAEMQGRSQAIQARQQALQYKQAGVKNLQQMSRNLATINARGAAGALDPFSGSTGNLMIANLAEGYGDYATNLENVLIAQENEKIVVGMANYQAAVYRSAAKQAQTSAMFGAVSTLAMGGYMAYDAGLFSSAAGSASAGMSTAGLSGSQYAATYGSSAPYTSSSTMYSVF